MMTLHPEAETTAPSAAVSGQGRGVLVVVALLLVEVLIIGLVFKHAVNFHCKQNWPTPLCHGASLSMASFYTAGALLAVLGMVFSEDRRALLAEAGLRRVPLLLNLAGVAAMLAPLPLLVDGSGTSNLPPVLGLWVLGIGLGAAGALLMLAPAARWGQVLRARGTVLAVVVAAGLVAPFITQEAAPLWRSSSLADTTFGLVQGLMAALGYTLQADPATKIIGTGTFLVAIGPPCSGVEGIALVGIFVTVYLGLFRSDLRFPRALLLYPIGIIASLALNVVRISALLAIGIAGHPELAIGAFHSHAGWLMFTVLSLALVALAQYTGFFAAQRPSGASVRSAAAAPFFADPVVAQILPFAVFMASALLASTFATTPALIYPMRAVAMAAALVLFLPYLRRLTWTLDPVALAAGLVIGVVWAATSPAASGSDLVLSDALKTLAKPAFLGWIATRVIGTTILVPVIEELFFRAYLLERLAGDRRQIWRVVLGVVVTSALFGALHDRWMLACIAGAVYAGLRLRSGKIGDAILAHAVSNAWIAGAAILSNDWSLI